MNHQTNRQRPELHWHQRLITAGLTGLIATIFLLSGAGGPIAVWAVAGSQPETSSAAADIAATAIAEPDDAGATVPVPDDAEQVVPPDDAVVSGTDAGIGQEPAGSDQPDSAPNLNEDDQTDTPQPVVAAVLAAGLLHSAMINYDGQLYVWGDNTYGQLGLGNLDYSDTPQLLSLPGQVISVSLGSYHTLAVLADGSVWSWGRNAYGQLGNGSIENASAPVQLDGLPEIVQVAAGAWHSLALGADGSVWAWGNNTDLQVGDVRVESIADSAGKILGTRCVKPVQIVAGGAMAIAAGGQFSMYLDENGQVYAWGDNQYGQLGDGTNQAHARPTQIKALAGVVSIAAGYQHALAISRQSGQDALMVWGDDSLGQLGIGSDLKAGASRSLPVRLDMTGDLDPTNDRIIRICAGYSQSAAVVPAQSKAARPTSAAAAATAAQSATSGTIVAASPSSIAEPAADRVKLLVWGNNVAGQLALGHTTSQNRPTPVSGAFNNWSGQDFLPYDAIALGGYHFLVLSSQGLLAAAGRGDRGQLGNQSVLDRSSLVPVDIPDVIRPAWLPNSRLSAEVSKAGDLTVRWPAAQDNRAVTGYRIRLRRADGQIQDKDVGLQQVCVFNAINTRQAFEIMVMAYDANSAAAENQTLSRLTGWIRPEGAAADAKREDYFSDWNETVWKLDYAASNWQLDPQGLIRPLDVPWDVSGIYDQPNLPVPADWHGFTGLTWLAGLLLILVLLDFLRRQIKRRGRTGLTPRRIKPGIANLL